MVSEIPSNWNTLHFSFILPVSSVVTSQWLKAHLLADRSVRANSQNPGRLHVGLRLLRAVEVLSLSLSEAWEAETRAFPLAVHCLLFSNIYTFCCSMKKSLLRLSHQFSLLQPKEKSFEKLQNLAGSHSAERQRRKKTELWSWILYTFKKKEASVCFIGIRVLALKGNPFFKG